MSIYLELFLTYFKIGLFTIGGGYAMIPLIQQEVVEKHGWLTMGELTDFIAVSESTPGPFAINTATFVGNKIAGIGGAVLTTLGVVLPSVIIILIIAAFFSRYKENKWLNAALYGMSAVIVGLIASAVFLLGQNIFLNNAGFDWRAGIIFIICLFLHFKLKIKPIPLIGIAAGAGILAYGLFEQIVFV